MTGRGPRHWYRYILVIPYVWAVALIPLVNESTRFPLGLPPLLLWMACTPVVTTLCLAAVYWRDRKLASDDNR